MIGERAHITNAMAQSHVSPQESSDGWSSDGDIVPNHGFTLVGGPPPPLPPNPQRRRLHVPQQPVVNMDALSGRLAQIEGTLAYLTATVDRLMTGGRPQRPPFQPVPQPRPVPRPRSTHVQKKQEEDDRLQEDECRFLVERIAREDQEAQERRRAEEEEQTRRMIHQIAEEEDAERRRLEMADAALANELQRMQEEESRRHREADEVVAAALNAQIRQEREEEVAARRYECVVCLDDEIPIGDIFIIDNCNHMYCRSCLLQHVKTTIEGGSPDVVCPTDECHEPIDAVQVRQLLELTEDQDRARVIGRLDDMFHDRFMARDPLYLRCPHILGGDDDSVPSVPCNMWGMRDDVGSRHAECLSCRHRFCGDCGHRDHEETCEAFAVVAAAEGGDQAANDELMRQWRAQSHSRPCPGCTMLVERTTGCNHMTCRCGHHYCYRCGATMSGSRFECGCPTFG